MAQIGDYVRFLNSVGGGRITKIEGPMAYVDEDGFETPVLLKEIVVVANAGQQPSKTTFKAPQKPQAKAEPAPVAAAPKPEVKLPVIETEGGDALNIVIGYEPTDIKRMSETTFDMYLVNDSNYYIGYVYLTRGADEGWVMRAKGIVEPNIQEFVIEVKREDLAHMDKIAMLVTAWKEGRNFDLKPAMTIEKNLDTTKFFKLHCFRPGEYFDNPTLSIDLVRNDKPCGAEKLMKTVTASEPQIDAKELERAMRRKKNADMRSRKRTLLHPAVKNNDIIEVDLHIDELVDTTAGLSPADILNYQVDEFRRVMDSNLKNHGQKIVFIHGKGEGVLRKALEKELNYRYKSCRVQDASFQEYGYGATQVTIP